MSRNRRDLNLKGFDDLSVVVCDRDQFCLPVDRIHDTLAAPKAGLLIRQRAAERRHRVVDAARITMEHLLADERPPVHLLCDIRRDGTTTLVGHVYVSWLITLSVTCWLGHERDVDAGMQQQDSCRRADGEGGGGAEAGADRECSARAEVERGPEQSISGTQTDSGGGKVPLVANGHDHIEVQEGSGGCASTMLWPD